MRVLKFRAWDGERMHESFDLSANPKYWWEGNKDYPLMQNTGFKDENGKEIYEGDIVKCTDGEGEVSKLNSDTGIGQIEWNKEWGFWNISNIENGLGDIIYHGFVEIVGNVYENKGLLEGDHCERRN